MAVPKGSMNRRVFAIAGFGAVVEMRSAFAQPATPASPVAVDAALYRVDLAASSLPATPIAFGVAGVLMTPGTAVVYPEGSAGQSVAIDHVLAGSYEIESDSELVHIDVAGNLSDIDAGESTTVAAGETIVILHNEAAQRITAGEEETRTLTVGFFSFEQGTNETQVEGTLEQQVLGGTMVGSVPDSGVTVTVVRPAEASGFVDPVAESPVVLSSGEEWAVVVLAADSN